MSVKRIRCTDDCQRRGIAKLREAMKDQGMAIGPHWKLQSALQSFETSHLIIKELLKRAEKYQERDLKAKGKA